MIRFTLPGGQEIEAEVIDVASNGALVLNVNGKAMRYISGEIQINH
jgi:biotin-(acetyl-CoA carboxylase) ligase